VSDRPDRLEHIKRECDAYDRYEPPNYPVEDVRWLIAEVERLRRMNLCSVCAGVALQSGRPCICAGGGSADDERDGLHVEVERLRGDVSAWKKACDYQKDVAIKCSDTAARFEREVERLRKENTDLREAISPARIGRNVDYYVAVAAKMREQQQRILPLQTKGAYRR